jgi:iron complex transport system substrate-binding protein
MFHKKAFAQSSLLVALTIIVAAIPVFAQDTITVVDSAGRVVEIPQPLERVVVINPPAAEVIAILGATDLVVGTSGSVVGKAELPGYAAITQVSRSAHGEVDLEVITQLEPQLVIHYASIGSIQGLADSLAPAGIPVVGIDAYKLDTLFSDILTLGQIFGNLPRAAELIVFLQSAIDTARNAVAQMTRDMPRVYGEHHGGAAYAIGSEWNTIFAWAGGNNIYGDQPMPYFEADPEVTIQLNPQVILFDSRSSAVGYGKTDEAAMAEALASYIDRPGWDTLDAVVNGSVYVVSSSIGSGPRKVFLAPFMAKAFYPELAIDPEALLATYHEDFLGVDQAGIFVYPMP